MNDKRKIKAGTACEIARIDKDRFNEAVHAGHYPCAPATRAGAARLFDIDDLVALYIYGRQLERGLTAPQAGQIACRVRDQTRSFPNETHIFIAYAENGSSYSSGGSGVDPKASHIAGLGRLTDFVGFHVANIREIVRKGVDEAELVVGHD